MINEDGANVNAMDANTGMAQLLEAAVLRKDKETVKLIFDANADVNQRDDKFQEAFELAISEYDPDIMKLFIDSGADVNGINRKMGKSVLQMAAGMCDLEMVKYLLSRGVDINVRDYLERTPLHEACVQLSFSEARDKELFKFLIKSGADVNAIDSYNRTPLMHSLVRGLVRYMFVVERTEYPGIRFVLKYFNVYTVDEKRQNILTLSKSYVKDVVNGILEHLAKLQSLGLPVRQEVMKLASNSDFFKKCTEELLMAKSTKFRRSWVSYYNVLVDKCRRVKNYAGNQELVEAVRSSDCLTRFPVYGATMQRRMENGVIVRGLYDDSCVLLSDNFPIFLPSHLVIRDTLDCLGKEDLMQFCEQN